MEKRLIAWVSAAAFLAGCGGTTGGTALTPGAGVTSESLVSHQGFGKIQHVVILVQENRTLDNLFNGFPGADTVTTGYDHNGNPVPLKPVSFSAPQDPSHSYQSLFTEYNNGKMNGFDLDPVNATILGGSANIPDFVYAYVPSAETVIYRQLAQTYALADRMFASQMAPSFPGHLYLIGGESAREVGDPVSSDPRVNAVWGCDSPPGSRVDILNAENQVVTNGGSPCINFRTLGDLADAHSVSWKYYSGLTNGYDLDGQVSAYDAISHIRYGPDWSTHVPQTPEREFQFFTDLTAGQLPQLSWLTPPATASDHAGDVANWGPDWVAQVVTAVEKSQYASNTAILITWDDSGGWYDHVAPPSFNGLNYGFRVPLVVISPYTKRGYVSHVTHDYGSMLHFVESVFHLGTLGQVDAAADDLSDMFDFSTARPFTLQLHPKHTLQQIEAVKSQFPVDSDL